LAGFPRREYYLRRTIVDSHDRALFARTDEKKRNGATDRIPYHVLRVASSRVNQRA
jgi:hypothetical protein